MPPRPPRIYGMPGIDWPAVGADRSRVAARFLAFLGDSRGVAYKATEARRRRIFVDYLICGSMWSAIAAALMCPLSSTFRTVAANVADALRASATSSCNKVDANGSEP